MAKKFSKIKKELEAEWIADSIEGKVLYQLTKYRKSHDGCYGRVTISLDKEIRLNISDFETIKQYGRVAVNDYEIISKGAITTDIFYASYNEYCNNSVEENIQSENALIRLFTILDRRLGKKRLHIYEEQLIRDVVWLKPYYDFRMKYEN